VGVLALVASASAGIPDASKCTATSAGGTLYICHQGDAESLGSVGASVSITVLDVNTVPINNFPFQDIWMKSAVAGQINLCQGGLTADANTNAAGQTTMSGVPSGGGCTQGPMQVVISGVALPALQNLNIRINSPDINGSLVTGLDDVGPFSIALNGVYNFCSDFFDDGLINLADVGIFSTHYHGGGVTCP
jgi:hypothetical protein